MLSNLLVLSLVSSLALGQTFRRTGACPQLGCIFPPDQTDFVAGQTFDIRIEAQAPVNGTEAYNGGKVDTDFTLHIGGDGAELIPITRFLGRQESAVQSYNFTYFSDLFAQQRAAPTPVNVLAKSYRNIQLHNPGTYRLVFKYNNGMTTEAEWIVKPLAKQAKAKNLIFFVGDGMATSMISAARLLAHKTINGKYQTMLKMDEAPAYGAQMTHSLDSFITDSANSASALFTGKKMTVNGLNAYTDSTGRGFGNPAVESIFEMYRRITGGQVGIVSKAYIADATPAAVCAHTAQRGQYTAIIEQYLNGISGNQSWYPWAGVDLLFGGGAEDFLPSAGNGNVSQFERWETYGYQLGLNNTQLQAFDNSQRALGLFTQGNISTWLDKNVYKNTLDLAVKPRGGRGAYDQPGLKDMTLKAIDILSTRAKARGTGWSLMSEAALIDKEMHVQDVHRALGDLLELDDTLRATLEHLEKIGELDETLIVVTADHGHGFDVFGSSDTDFMKAQTTDRAKRNAVGTYEQSGLSSYVVPSGIDPTNHTIFTGPNGPGFPVNWDPRYTIAHGWSAFPDKREDYQTHNSSERLPSVRANATAGYFFNPADAPTGFQMSGNIGTANGQGVHSLVDVPIYAWGPGHELFRGVMGNVDIAFRVAEALGLGRDSNVTAPYQK